MFFNSAFAELWGLSPAWLESTPSLGDILGALRAQNFVSHVERLTTNPGAAPGQTDEGQPTLPLGGIAAQTNVPAGVAGS